MYDLSLLSPSVNRGVTGDMFLHSSRNMWPYLVFPFSLILNICL